MIKLVCDLIQATPHSPALPDPLIGSKTRNGFIKMLVGAVIGRPCEIRKGATDDRPYEEYDGRQKPLLEERCHEVTEWWNKKRNA